MRDKSAVGLEGPKCYTTPLTFTDHLAMTQLKTPSPKKRPARAELTANPFLDNELYARMRDYTEREAAIAKELRAIVERGAGKRQSDPRLAPSLDTIRGMVKKGISLTEMFNRIAAGTERGLWEPWMSAFGFEIRTVNYEPAAPRNACLALDLGAGAKVNPSFAKAGMANWRSHAAEDCAELKIQKATDKAPMKIYAMFYLDPPAK